MLPSSTSVAVRGRRHDPRELRPLAGGLTHRQPATAVRRGSQRRIQRDLGDQCPTALVEQPCHLTLDESEVVLCSWAVVSLRDSSANTLICAIIAFYKYLRRANDTEAAVGDRRRRLEPRVPRTWTKGRSINVV
jgi:hypothetical protein